MKIAIRCQGGEFVDMESLYLSTPGLAVHVTPVWFGLDRELRTVTHVQSGYRIVTVRGRGAALRACKALGRLCDWTRPARDITPLAPRINAVRMWR
jgi:hypothetical protein